MARQITGVNDIPSILDENKTNSINEFIEKAKMEFSNQMDFECEAQRQPVNILQSDLAELIRLFYEDKQQLDNYKKSTDEYNKNIKQAMSELDLTEFETEDLIAKIGTQNRESFNESKLLEKLKSLGNLSAIKTKEYVDMNELENLIYNGELNASELTNCKEVKTVTTLKVSKKKGI